MEQNIADMEVAYREFGEGKATRTPRARIFKNTGGVGISDVTIDGLLYEKAKEKGLSLELFFDGAE